MPAAIRMRIRNYSWSHKELESKNNEAEILEVLSPSLREEILVWNYGKVLLRQEHFIGAPDVFLVTVAAFIAHGLFGPTDTITQQGNIRNEPFYILTKGEVVMYRNRVGEPGTKLVQRMKYTVNKGGYWNDRQLIFDSPADTSVAAATFVEVFAIPGAEMRDLMYQFPSGYLRTRTIVMRRLWRLAFTKASVHYGLKRILQHKRHLDIMMQTQVIRSENQELKKAFLIQKKMERNLEFSRRKLSADREINLEQMHAHLAHLGDHSNKAADQLGALLHKVSNAGEPGPNADFDKIEGENKEDLDKIMEKGLDDINDPKGHEALREEVQKRKERKDREHAKLEALKERYEEHHDEEHDDDHPEWVTKHDLHDDLEHPVEFDEEHLLHVAHNVLGPNATNKTKQIKSPKSPYGKRVKAELGGTAAPYHPKREKADEFGHTVDKSDAEVINNTSRCISLSFIFHSRSLSLAFSLKPQTSR
jgi:CRP-like cAMP-binding protein